MTKIREGYLALSKRDPNRWLVIECADMSSEEIFALISEEADRRLQYDK